MSTYLVTVALIAVIIGIASALVMTGYVSRRGTSINYPLLRLYILRYAHQYREMTRRERGKTGPWFYAFVISMNTALLFALLAWLAS